MAFKIACVGGLTLDWLERGGVRRGPYPGGNALYSAVGVWLTGACPVIVASVGHDYPRSFLGDIEKAGIATNWLRTSAVNSRHMLLKEIRGQRVLQFLDSADPKSVMEIQASEMPSEEIDGAHICGAGFTRQLAVLQEFKRHNIPTSLDLIFVAGEIEPTLDEVRLLSRHTDVFLPSFSEVKRMLHSATSTHALRKLRAQMTDIAVLRLGAAGSLGCQGDHLIFVPAVSCAVVDTTGAGDAYCGAFQAKWVETGDIRTAMTWGAAAASVVIEDVGAMHALAPDARCRTQIRADLTMNAFLATSVDS
jgi:ribokinase